MSLDFSQLHHRLQRIYKFWMRFCSLFGIFILGFRHQTVDFNTFDSERKVSFAFPLGVGLGLFGAGLLADVGEVPEFYEAEFVAEVEVYSGLEFVEVLVVILI